MLDLKAIRKTVEPFEAGCYWDENITAPCHATGTDEYLILLADEGPTLVGTAHTKEAARLIADAPANILALCVEVEQARIERDDLALTVNEARLLVDVAVKGPEAGRGDEFKALLQRLSDASGYEP